MTTNKLAASDLVGTVLEGGYRIDGLLGEGGMGAVYSATHLRLEKHVEHRFFLRVFFAFCEDVAADQAAAAKRLG